MNAYGYDYYVPNDNLYYDETSYLETIKPLDKIENFENEVDNLINDNEQTSIMQNIIDKKNKLCNVLYNNFKKCQNHMKYKHYELQQAHSHIFFLYILLIFSIVCIFYQKMSIDNLTKIIEIIKSNKSPSV